MTSKALLIGINYFGTSAELQGCINDCNNLKGVLLNKFSFSADSIKFLNDLPENKNTLLYPTAANIRKALKELVTEAKTGKINKLWLSYSGHGSNTADKSGDELDGKDEMWCPVDYDVTVFMGKRRPIEERFILDDEIYTLLQQLPASCTCFVMSDSCHSGSIMDLKYMYDPVTGQYKKQQNKLDTAAQIICISGCKDEQTSADASIDNKYCGAMTWSFLKVLESATILKYDDLVLQMQALLKGKYEQVPCLTTSTPLSQNDLFYVNKTSKIMFM